MFQNVEWLFFDIGSTLVNEEKVYEHLIRLLSQRVNLSCEEIAAMVLAAYQHNRNGFADTAAKLGVIKPRWEPSLEFLYEDAQAVLKKLHTKYKIGIIANQEVGCKERLEKMGIAQYFDFTAYSAEEGVSKPDLKLFHIALSKCSCQPQNAIMIGDRIDNDILPAKSLGMHTVWVKQGYGQYWSIRRPEETPDAIVQNLSALLEILL